MDTGASVGDMSGVGRTLYACDLRPQRPFRLATGGEEFQVAFFEGPPFKFKKSSKQHTNYLMCLRYNRSGELFVTGSSDRKMYLYEGRDCGELREVKSAQPHTRTVTGVAWLDEGSFATSSNDTTVKLWAVSGDDSLLKTLRVAEKPHEVDEMQVAVAECGGDLYSVSLFGCLNQWKGARDAPDGALPTARFHGHQNLVGCLLEDHVNRLVFSGDNNGKIRKH